MNKPITLYVPDRLGPLAKECQAAYRLPVQIESYQHFGRSLYQQLQAEEVICVTGLDTFVRYEDGGAADNGATRRTGKALLLTAGPHLGSGTGLHSVQGVDLVSEDVSPGLWTFKINKALSEIEYDREIRLLREGDVKNRRDLDTLNEIGMALSTEKDLDKLLDMIVTKCREMTAADGGTLYMIEPDPELLEDPDDYFANKKMRFRVAQTYSRKVPFQSFLVDIKKTSVYGYVALTQTPLNIADAYFIAPDAEYTWGGREFDAAIGYRTMSMLTVPMVNYQGDTIGVIQLINRKEDPHTVLGEPETFSEHVMPFTIHDERMAQSIASQASIAIQNAQLVEDIKTLFNGFIKASVKAIESRDPTTSGHSQRVATLTVGLAEKVDRAELPRFRDVHFGYDALQELRYASLLHDFGKIGVRENVLVKAKKLYPAEQQQVLSRFDLIRRSYEVDHLRRQVQHLLEASKDHAMPLVDRERDAFEEQARELQELLDFIMKCNEPAVLAEGGFERLHEVAAMRFRNWDGVEVPFLDEHELISLSVPKGSLNEHDRKEIESHVTHTYKFLCEIPWTKDLRHVPDIAYAHHEKLDGTGYPNRLTADRIPLGSRMMTIADIFDALTAWDRPYKKAVPVERALNILQEEAKAHHVDKDLLDIFIDAELFRLVEEREQT